MRILHNVVALNEITSQNEARVFGIKMLGRPRRSRAEEGRLLQIELSWQVVFAWIRYGIVGGDDSIPLKKLEALDRMNQQIGRESPSSDRLLDDRDIMLDPPDDLPAEPVVWRILTDPKSTPAQIRQICKTSIYIGGLGTPWGRTLSKYAEAFCDSKKTDAGGKRYPGANALNSKLRPSSQDKRADYLARVLAVLSLRNAPPISSATADRLLRDIHRKAKHGAHCPCWRCVCEHPLGFPDARLIDKWRSMKGRGGTKFFANRIAGRRVAQYRSTVQINHRLGN
jgi:hypothetical protein